jgi:hypothetical protein
MTSIDWDRYVTHDVRRAKSAACRSYEAAGKQGLAIDTIYPVTTFALGCLHHEIQVEGRFRNANDFIMFIIDAPQ